jgi:hypothetical protein
MNSRCSFDHLVGAGKQRFRHSEPERLGCLEIDYQLEPSDLPVQAPTKYTSDAGLKLCIVRGAGQKQA